MLSKGVASHLRRQGRDELSSSMLIQRGDARSDGLLPAQGRDETDGPSLPGMEIAFLPAAKLRRCAGSFSSSMPPDLGDACSVMRQAISPSSRERTHLARAY
jgi:hypothetical protein